MISEAGNVARFPRAAIFERGLARLAGARGSPPPVRDAVTAQSLGLGGNIVRTDQEAAMRISTVSRCIDILSDSIAKMPFFVYDRSSRERIDHPVLQLLELRPNRWQTPTVWKKQMEAERVANGNGLAWICRDPHTLEPTELVAIPHGYWNAQLLSGGDVLYTIQHPFTGQTIRCGRMDVLHVMAYTRNGYKGIGYLERAQDIITTARAAQEYASAYYLNGGQPAGVLKTDSDLSGMISVPDPETGEMRMISKKDRMREEWEKRYAGPSNAHRIAVLDMGVEYKPISISNADAQFIEQMGLTVEDLGRIFGVPLYKLQAGKQAYSSNEQNAIEYVVGTVHPNCTVWEQELLYKLLPPQDVEKGLRIRGNIMNELRGDFASRAAWYKGMREAGAFSVNNILALEDMPDVPGGDEHYASLNFVPLEDWRELSRKRAEKGAGNGGDAR